MDVSHISQIVANSVFLVLVVGIPLLGVARRVNVYETFVAGARQGFDVSVTIIPYLVAMLVAIGMFRASGALDHIAVWLAPVLSAIGMPAEILPFALMRPFSGSASIGVMADIIQTHGGQAYISQLAATMLGSTETTFYVVAVYFGAVKISQTRYAIPCGLVADAVGIFSALWICRWVLLG